MDTGNFVKLDFAKAGSVSHIMDQEEEDEYENNNDYMDKSLGMIKKKIVKKSSPSHSIDKNSAEKSI